MAQSRKMWLYVHELQEGRLAQLGEQLVYTE